MNFLLFLKCCFENLPTSLFHQFSIVIFISKASLRSSGDFNLVVVLLLVMAFLIIFISASTSTLYSFAHSAIFAIFAVFAPMVLFKGSQ